MRLESIREEQSEESHKSPQNHQNKVEYQYRPNLGGSIAVQKKQTFTEAIAKKPKAAHVKILSEP